MPSRMVPAQQLADVEDALLRLAAAKDAEIAALKADLDAATATFDDEQAAHQDTLRLWQQAKAEIAALTERVRQLDAANQKFMREAAEWKQAEDDMREKHDRATEQRDRAMKVVEIARAYRGITLDAALAAFDAETAS